MQKVYVVHRGAENSVWSPFLKGLLCGGPGQNPSWCIPKESLRRSNQCVTWEEKE